MIAANRLFQKSNVKCVRSQTNVSVKFHVFSVFFHQIPVSLHKMVSDRITNIVKGRDPDAIAGLQNLHWSRSYWFVHLVLSMNLNSLCVFTAGSTYCTRMDAKAFAENAEKNTKEELWSLLRTIHENPKFSAKEKRRLLGQFYKGHPEIYIQYFGNRLSSVNMLLQ